MHARHRRRGFTLIELLVVIAIIAILAAILFPVFAQAREAARKTTCISNLKQSSLAILMYTQDYDEVLPWAAYNPAGLPLIMWYDLVEPYIKVGAGGVMDPTFGPVGRRQVSFHICPTFRNNEIPIASGGPTPVAFPAGQLDPAMGYVTNGNLMPMNHTALPGVFFPGPISSLASIQGPASVVLLAHGRGVRPAVAGDDVTSACTGGEAGFPALPNPAITSASVYCAARHRHSGGSVYALADGHAKWFKGPGAWNLRSDNGVAYRKSLSPNAAAWFRED
jgi:prepilin-type N-terminal cleavage/methylation domain-containing protein/prepilin-type processing-associated H-X9-DG protein